MKVLIVSDSHGLTDELEMLKKKHGDIDHYIHCGDSELPEDHPAINGYHVVKGNCDFGAAFPNQLIVEADSEKIFVTHGHLYNVKISLINLHYKAMEQQSKIVCFGHSHVLGCELIDDILFINPGSISLPRGRKERTYVVLELADTERIVHVYDFDQSEPIITQTFGK